MPRRDSNARRLPPHEPPTIGPSRKDLMLYKDYGNLGIKVSAVGCGGMRWDMEKSLEENAELIRYANGKGITYLDTAPGYCGDKSEDIFGIALKDMPGQWTISTKGMPTTFDTAEKAVEAVKTSCERLGVDCIDFYHVWCIRERAHYDLAMKPGGQYEGLLRCKEEGLIKHIVVSSHQQGDGIVEIMDQGHFEGVLLGCNLLNFPYRWAAVQACYERGYGVVAMNPLAGGQIPQYEEKLGFLAKAGETPTEAALRFAICAPQISVALVGFTTKEHIDTACRIADEAAPFAAAELDRIRERLDETADQICTGCGYCKDCPADVPVAAYMQVYNQHHLLGRDEEEMKSCLAGNYQWGMLVGAQGSLQRCTRCGACEEACTQHLPIMDRLHKMRDWEPEESATE